MAVTIDTSIQYRGYNTIKLVAPAKFRCWPFGVQGLSYISHGFCVYTPSALPSAVRATTRFIKSNGVTHSTVSHSFAVPVGMFTWIKLEAIAVPIGAVMTVLELSNSSGTYWAGLIKSEAGQVATDYTANYAGQLTMITASGIYTGTIQAAQIIISSGEKLTDRLVTINERLIALTDQSTNSETRIMAQGLSITSLQSSQSSLGTRVTSAETTITSLGISISSQGTRLTNIEAGRIYLSSQTLGQLAGMELTSTGLTLSATGAFFRISTNPNDGYFIYSGPSPQQRNFLLRRDGSIEANNATFQGEVRAGSIIGGSLNNTTGRHDGTHYGYQEGSSYGSHSGSLNGTTGYHSGTMNGSLEGTGGWHDGRIYPPYGQLSGYRFEAGTIDGGPAGGVGCLKFPGYMNVNSLFARNLSTYSFTNASDRRLKQNITPISERLAHDLYKLEIVEFEYKSNPGEKQIGIIANDVVEKTDSEFHLRLVQPAENGYFSFNYFALHTLVLLGLQNLDKRLRELEEKSR